MKAKERTPERRREDATQEVGGDKPAPAPALTPAVPAWLAFPSAGICSAAAGYLLMTVGTFRDVYASMGVELPWITHVVMSGPLLIPAALLATAVALLGLGAWRRAATPLWQTAGGVARGAALVAGGAGCLCIMANAVVFDSLQKALQH